MYGGGPFVTEQHGPAGEELRKRGNEFGAVTGRPRRCGWFDAAVMRYARMVNGIEHLVVTKLDVLDHLAEIPVCTGYRYKGTVLTEMPALVRQLEHVEPVYKPMPGWQSSTEGLTTYEQLPQVARDYLKFLEDVSEVEICMVSTGPEREQTMWVPRSKMASAWSYSFADARAEVLNRISAARGVVEDVPLESAAGRVLAEDILADRDYPPFPRATRDGFAVPRRRCSCAAHGIGPSRHPRNADHHRGSESR